MMHAQYAIDLVISWIGIFVDQVLGPGYNSRRAEAALQTARGDKAVSKSFAFKLAETFKRQHRLACGVLGRHRAGDDSSTVDDHRAASTLPLRATAVFGRDHSALIAQHFKKRHSIFDVDGAFGRVQRELDAVSHFSHLSPPDAFRLNRTIPASEASSF